MDIYQPPMTYCSFHYSVVEIKDKITLDSYIDREMGLSGIVCMCVVGGHALHVMGVVIVPSEICCEYENK